MSKRNRDRRVPVFPDAPPGFTLRWLDKQRARPGVPRLGLFLKNLPPDWDKRSQPIADHARTQKGKTPDDSLAGSIWYSLHWAWERHPQWGVLSFLDQQHRARGKPQGGLSIAIEALPRDRREILWDDPHILMALFPDGSFCRLLASSFLGLTAVAVDTFKGTGENLDRRVSPLDPFVSATATIPGSIKGPPSVAVRGQILNDGKATEISRLEDERLITSDDDSLILLDPLCLIADYGPVVNQDHEGRFLFRRGSEPIRLYHPDEDPWHGHLKDSQKRFLRLWDGAVPGFAGKIGPFKALRDRFEAEERQKQEQQQAAQGPEPVIPTHAVYAQALQAQMDILGFCRREHPFERVSRRVAEDNGRRTDTDFFRFVREQDALVIAALEQAHPVFWTADMLTVLEGLEPSLKTWTVSERDFLHHSGFVWFQRPLRIVPGDPEVMTGYLWHLRKHEGLLGYQVVPFTRYEGRPEDVPRDVWTKSISGNAPLHGVPRRLLFFPLGGTLAGYLASIGSWHDDPNSSVLSAIYSGTTPDLDRKQMTRWARIFAASIVLMGQRLTRLSDFRADRAGRKRAQVTLQAEPPLIKTVLLRRVDYVNRHPNPKGESEPVNWSHRWMVSRHWREQWFPSEQRHKSIVIEAHVKGPADKPLWIPPGGEVDIIGR